jgi:hypothetical protein
MGTKSHPEVDGSAGRALTALWIVATALVVWSLCCCAMFNTDLWFHLAAGRLIVEQRAIPRVDPWSFAAPHLPWLNHEWLSDVLLHLWDSTFGSESLIYWMWLCLLATFLLLFWVLRRLSGSALFSFLATGLCAALGSPFFEIRPNLLTQLLFVAVYPLVVLRIRPWWGLPAVAALWINLHGGGVFGLLAIGVALAARLLARPPAEAAGDPPRPFRLPALFGACVAASLLNPFGFRALIYPFELALLSGSVSRQFLGEWQPPFAPGGIQSPWFSFSLGLAAVALLVLFPRLKRREAVALSVVGLAALTLAMALQSRRFIPLFALALGPYLAVAWSALAQVWLSSPRPRRRRKARSADPGSRFRGWRYALVLAALGLGCMRLSSYPLAPRAFNALVKLDWMPVESLNFIDANGFSGNVFADFEWGGYIHYRTAGRMKVFTDPRSETVYPDEVQLRYIRCVALQGDWLETIESSGAQYVLWPPSEHNGEIILPGLLRTGRWRELYRDRRSVLLMRTGVPVSPALHPTPPSAFRTWALAHRARISGRYEEAERLLLQTLQEKPVLVEACRDLTLVQALQGSRDAALATADRCQKIFPDNAWRQRLLSYLDGASRGTTSRSS